jgi:hypothetical protein
MVVAPQIIGLMQPIGMPLLLLATILFLPVRRDSLLITTPRQTEAMQVLLSRQMLARLRSQVTG